jgi:hypothetical protein
MVTFNTGNSVPSTDGRDLSDNAETIDELVDSSLFSTITRTNKSVLTRKGLEAQYVFTAINSGVWAAGQTFTAVNQYMVFSGTAYKPKNSTALPYVVGATPVGDNNVEVVANLSTAQGDVRYHRGFDDLSSAVAAIDLLLGQKIILKEHTTGKGGTGVWDAITKGTTAGVDLPNAIDIVASTGNTSLVLKLRVGWTLDLRAVGINGDGVTQNQDLIINRALIHPDSTIVHGQLADTYFINKPVIVGENKTLNGNGCNFTSAIGSFTYVHLPFTAMIVLGDPDDRVGTKKERCHVTNCNLVFAFLGNISIPADIDTLANYTSPTQYGIRAQLTNNSSVSHCLVSGFETTLVGAEWSDNFEFHDNTLSVARFHGIGNQGGTAVARNQKCFRNLVLSIGGIAFDINTVAGSVAWLNDNKGSNIRQFYKTTDGTAITKGNVFTAWAESNNIFSAYGNSQGLTSTSDKMFGFNRLTASGSSNVKYLWNDIEYVTTRGTLMTLQDNSIYKINGGIIDIKGDAGNALPMIHWGGTATKAGTSLSITTANQKYDTTLLPNDATQGFVSLNGWTDCNFNISDSELISITGLSSQRLIINVASNIASTEGLFVMAGNTIKAVGIDPQLGMFLKDAHNVKVHDNSIKGVAVGSYETNEDGALNFRQYSNFSNVQFTLAIGTDNRLFDYIALGRSGNATPVGSKTPEFRGQRFFDSTAGDLYQAFGTLNTQWHKLNP